MTNLPFSTLEAGSLTITASDGKPLIVFYADGRMQVLAALKTDEVGQAVIDSMKDAFRRSIIGPPRAAQSSVPLQHIADDSRGNRLYCQDNEAGGRNYWSDEIGGGVMVWNTSLCSREMVELALAKEKAKEPR